MKHVRNGLLASSSFSLIVAAFGCGDVPQSAGPASGEDASGGLALAMVDGERVAGTFEAQSMALAFDARLEGECNVVDVKDASGRRLLGARSCPDGDALELAGRGVVPFPAGTLTRTMANGGSNVLVADAGDEAHLAEFAYSDTYNWLRALTRVMTEHPSFVGMELATPSSPELGVDLSPQGHDPEGCEACHGACAAAWATCALIAGWSPAIIICGIVAIGCHTACATTVCQ